MKEFEERSKRILEYVNSKEYKIMTAKQIAVVFGVPKDDMNEFEKIINKEKLNDLQVNQIFKSENQLIEYLEVFDYNVVSSNEFDESVNAVICNNKNRKSNKI